MKINDKILKNFRAKKFRTICRKFFEQNRLLNFFGWKPVI